MKHAVRDAVTASEPRQPAAGKDADHLPATMAAVVCHAPHDYRLEEVAVPRPGPEEVLIRVRAVGVCASDLRCFNGAPAFWGDGNTGGYCQAPVIPGHEFAGQVVALGPGAAERYEVSLGATVVSEQIVPCWNCARCRRGEYWMCVLNDSYGFRRRTPGAMAEFALLPRGALNHRVPAGMAPTHGAFVEPLACAVHAVQRGGIEFGDVVVVAGAGPLGLGMIAAARLKNPRALIALDLSQHRLNIARACGADLAINPASDDDVLERVLELTDGEGCDVYLEATGKPAAVQQGLRMTRKLGTLVAFGLMTDDVTLDWNMIGDGKELDVRGSHLSPYTFDIAIEMIASGLLPMEQIITHELGLDSFAEAFDLAAAGDTTIKVDLVPGRGSG